MPAYLTMNKQSLIAMAAAFALSASRMQVDPVPASYGIPTGRRGYRKTGKHGVEQRKAWLVAKNKEAQARASIKLWRGI